MQFLFFFINNQCQLQNYLNLIFQQMSLEIIY